MRKTIVGLSVCLALFAGLAVGAPAHSAADAISVNTTLDVIDNDDGLCSLREALIAANTDANSGAVPGECQDSADPDRIVLPGGVYELTIFGSQEDLAHTGDLDITESVTISGGGVTCGPALPPDYPGCTIVSAEGIDRVFHIHGPAEARIEAMLIENGLDSGYSGGGIYVADNAELALEHSQLVANNSTVQGGALFVANFAVARLVAVGFTNNSAPNGGAVWNGGELFLEHVSMSFGNTASAGGCLLNWDTAQITYSDFNYCQAEGSGLSIPGNGGAIASHGPLTVEYSSFHNNTADIDTGSGGAIWTHGETIIRSSTFSGNNASEGGAVSMQGLWSSYTTALVNLTFASNISRGVTAVYVGAGSATVANTIFGDGSSNSCAGSITSLGHNLEADDGDTCSLTAPGDQVDVDPDLGAWLPFLHVHPIDEYSAAANAGSNALCTPLDQRGYPRPSEGACDIGAYEYWAYEPFIFLPLIIR